MAREAEEFAQLEAQEIYTPPQDYPRLFADDTLEDIYHLGCTDRDLGIPSHSLEYSDRDERAAYVAGRCAARRVLSIKEMLAELEALQDALEDENFWRLGAW